MENVIDNHEHWKYAIISMHNALQGYMCISLRNGNNFLTWKEKHLKKWMASFENGKKIPFPQLDFFMELFDKLFADKYDLDRNKISSLNNLRNNMIHFNTDFYSIQFKQAYDCCVEALQAIKLTKKLSKGIFFYEEEQNKSFNKAVERAENILLKYEQFTT